MAAAVNIYGAYAVNMFPIIRNKLDFISRDISDLQAISVNTVGRAVLKFVGLQF